MKRLYILILMAVLCMAIGCASTTQQMVVSAEQQEFLKKINGARYITNGLER